MCTLLPFRGGVTDQESLLNPGSGSNSVYGPHRSLWFLSKDMLVCTVVSLEKYKIIHEGKKHSTYRHTMSVKMRVRTDLRLSDIHQFFNV